MEVFAFFKFMANLVIALVLLHLIKEVAVKQNPDSSFAKGIAYITAG